MEDFGPPPQIGGRHPRRPGDHRLGPHRLLAGVGLQHLAQELQQGHSLVDHVAGLGRLGELTQDVAAALGLFDEQPRVVAQRAFRVARPGLAR